jgi:hypothetical protein
MLAFFSVVFHKGSNEIIKEKEAGSVGQRGK